MVTLLLVLVSLVDNEKNTQKIHKVCWPFRRPCGCAGAIRRASPDRAASRGATERLNRAIIRTVSPRHVRHGHRSEEHTSELQSLTD